MSMHNAYLDIEVEHNNKDYSIHGIVTANRRPLEDNATHLLHFPLAQRYRYVCE